ncbi:MAG: alkaline phosphatase PhoX, partial [Planctomycetota bacterium]
MPAVQTSVSRRSFLSASTAAAVGSAGAARGFAAFGRNPRPSEQAATAGAGFGPLSPVADETTGLPLLQLPAGFRYKSFGWTGEPLTGPGETGERRTPADHDGMGVVAESIENGRRIVTLVRNHELSGGGSTGYQAVDGRTAYDPKAPGGCTALRFDATAGAWLDASLALSGTVKNCAGGPTGRGSWFSCEETVDGPGETDDEGVTHPYEKTHGWVFEVDPRAAANGAATTPQPIEGMGRFKHEAVAVDPADGAVYLTEDQGKCGLYQFVPRDPARPIAGGALYMLKVPNRDDLRSGSKPGEEYPVEWVLIDDPTVGHSPAGLAEGIWDEKGVYRQGRAKGATRFARMEGAWAGPDGEGRPGIWAVSTSGGAKELGQVWFFDPARQKLRLIFETPGAEVLDSPDNITVSPRGGVVLCEDGDIVPQRLHGLTKTGELFPLAANNAVLTEPGPGGAPPE